MGLFLLLLFLFLTIVVLLVFLLLLHKSNKRPSVGGKAIIEKFEPDNVAPTLTEMIDYHKANGIINYDFEN